MKKIFKNPMAQVLRVDNVDITTASGGAVGPQNMPVSPTPAGSGDAPARMGGPKLE